MIGAKVKTKDETRRVLAKAKQGSFKSLGHAGAAIRLVARRSIRRRKKKSPTGRPPHTRRGQLKRALKYHVERKKPSVVIGPEHAVVGESGKAHEHGGLYKGDRYDRRPFMGPALAEVQPRLPRLWAGSVR